MKNIGLVGGLALVLTTIGASAWALQPVAPQTAPEVHVVGRIVNVREQPSPQGKVLFQARHGDKLLLVDRLKDWLLVEAPGGQRGWVYRPLVEVVEAQAPATTPPAAVAPAAASPRAPAATAPGLSVEHSRVGCVLAEEYPKFEACLTPSSGVGRAQIHFRASGSGPWYGVDLKHDGPCYSAYLPKPQATTREFQYYVDVFDRSFDETRVPAGAPQESYRAQVVKHSRECSLAGRLARSAAKAGPSILVFLASQAGGGAAAGGSTVAGFSMEGVIMSGATSVASAGTAGGASASANAGGSSGRLLLIGAGVAAVGAAAVVVATRGGDNGGSDQSQQPGTGDVAFRLRWSTAADLDLYVQEPNGNVIYYANRTSSTNGQLDIDSNAACGTASASPVENVYWPTGTAPHGTYTFWANHYGCGLSSSFTLQVLRGVGGSVAASYSGNLAPYQDSTHYTFVY